MNNIIEEEVNWNYEHFINWINNGCDETIGNTVRNLDISCRHLDIIPEQVFNLRNLNELNVSNNELCDIQPTIELLTSLKCLNVSFNYIIAIPKKVFELPALQQLYCYCNRLTSIGDIKYATNLLEFDCKVNDIEITNIDEFVNNIQHLPLEVLNLSFNNINDDEYTLLEEKINQNIESIKTLILYDHDNEEDDYETFSDLYNNAHMDVDDDNNTSQ